MLDAGRGRALTPDEFLAAAAECTAAERDALQPPPAARAVLHRASLVLAEHPVRPQRRETVLLPVAKCALLGLLCYLALADLPNLCVQGMQALLHSLRISSGQTLNLFLEVMYGLSACTHLLA
jgi:hypothetical protein